MYPKSLPLGHRCLILLSHWHLNSLSKNKYLHAQQRTCATARLPAFTFACSASLAHMFYILSSFPWSDFLDIKLQVVVFPSKDTTDLSTPDSQRKLRNLTFHVVIEQGQYNLTWPTPRSQVCPRRSAILDNLLAAIGVLGQMNILNTWPAEPVMEYYVHDLSSATSVRTGMFLHGSYTMLSSKYFLLRNLYPGAPRPWPMWIWCYRQVSLNLQTLKKNLPPLVQP